MRMKLIAGNWKMYKNSQEAKELVQGLKDCLSKPLENACVVVCPPFTVLKEVCQVIDGSSIKLGAQNLYWEKEGPFTGEVSAGMLKNAGCAFVIIGHSERRKYFGETNESVNKKIKAALENDLTPIVCVGETLQQRQNNQTLRVVEDHVEGALQGIASSDILKIVIAYEPVWAIGTGVNATPKQAQEVHKYIRSLLGNMYSQEVSKNLLILYGGSVKPDNIGDLIKEEDIDGALVGGASLKVDSFTQIVDKSIKANV
ncbi:MAG: triose-phosphate isomerase [Candidatus Omnitrophica bacterium]|nr:triose-phosphate isomerase [Candidatus Omnitrophota bacterium]